MPHLRPRATPLPRLRRAFSSGEPLTPELAAGFRESLPEVSLHKPPTPTAARTFTHYPTYTMMSGFDADLERDRKLVTTDIENAAEDIPDPTRRDKLLAAIDEMLDERLSDVAADLDRIDLLKIDVEGTELEVLQDIDERTWPMIGNAVVEVADCNGKLRAIEEIFRRHGMRTAVHQPREFRRTDLSILFAQRR